MVIDSSYVISNTLLDNLATEDPIKINKYIKRAELLIFSYVNKNQFKQADGTFLYPDDLKLAILFIVEYLYLNNGIIKDKYKSEKIGDYSYTLSDIKTVKDLDLPQNILVILDKYRGKASFIDITISNYDRKYVNK